MESIREHGTQVGSQLEQWGARLDELMAKAGVIGEPAKHDDSEHVAALKTNHAVARSRLAELEAASSDRWVIVKRDFETALREVETAFKQLNS